MRVRPVIELAGIWGKQHISGGGHTISSPIAISVFLRLARRLNEVNSAICLGLLGVVFCAQILVVVLRYLFNIGFIELQDLVTYCFAGLCILSIPVALRTDGHVRVDIFRALQSAATARRVDQVAILVALLPVFGLTLWFGWPLVAYSWSIFEGSRETGGLPGFFIVLTALPVSCCLIIVQGLAIALDANLIHGRRTGTRGARDEH